MWVLGSATGVGGWAEYSGIYWYLFEGRMLGCAHRLLCLVLMLYELLCRHLDCMRMSSFTRLKRHDIKSSFRRIMEYGWNWR
jgi:hypothetical protein